MIRIRKRRLHSPDDEILELFNLNTHIQLMLFYIMTGSEKAALLESIGARSGLDLRQHQQPQQDPQLQSTGINLNDIMN